MNTDEHQHVGEGASTMTEQNSIDNRIATIENDWENNPRWNGVTRDYSAADVVNLQGRVQEENTLAKRGSEKLWKQLTEETPPVVTPTH